jgi:hypothetical protein
LEEEGEEGMIHSLLSSLPNIADDPLDEEECVAKNFPPLDQESTNDLDATALFKEEPLQTSPDGVVNRDKDSILDHVKADSERHDGPADDQEQALDSDKLSLEQDHNNDEVQSARSSQKISEVLLEDGKVKSAIEEHVLDKVEDPEMPAVDPTSIIPSLTTVKLEDDEEILSACSVCPKLTKIFLTDLLKHADTLYSTFPPSHSGLSLSSIMGPQSVVFTWSESPSSLPSDNTAEAMVSCPELVVYPYIEASSPAQMKSKEVSESEERTSKKARRKHHKLRKSPFSHMEKKTMVAGTVIALGVAMAIYGVKVSRTADRGVLHSLVDDHGHKDWRRLGGWVSGAVAGVTTKIMNGLSSTNS